MADPLDVAIVSASLQRIQVGASKLMDQTHSNGSLVLEDGSIFNGKIIGHHDSIAGEVVFNTGMVGYPETFTDPSYKGQILALTYPLIGNYGVPHSQTIEGLSTVFESNEVQVQGVVMTDYSFEYSHWNAQKSLDEWFKEQKVLGLYGIDTRQLTKKLRQRGSMLGKIISDGQDRDFYDPNRENLVRLVSVKEPLVYGTGKKKVMLIDCGGKFNIIRSLVGRGVQVKRVPWDYDFLNEDFDGVMISNGPGDPQMCQPTVAFVRKLLEGNRPVFGICLGHQILSLAAGAETYKMKFGHRSQNQPCLELATQRCYITSQNHGFAVKPTGLSSDWEPWFFNANDGSNEGIRHQSKPFMSVQFHPEATPGPTDTSHLFDRFIDLL